MDIYPRVRNEYIDLFYCNGLANKSQMGVLKNKAALELEEVWIFIQIRNTMVKTNSVQQNIM